MSSFVGDEYEFKVFILTIVSGTLCLFSLPQLIIGIRKICKMRKLQLPKAIFYTCLLSLISAYLVMLTVCLLSIFVNFIEPYIDDDWGDTNYNPHNDWDDSTFDGLNRRRMLLRADGGKHGEYLDEDEEDFELPEMIIIGVSVVELLFIISKASINLLFLCRLYYSFKDTLFHYSFKSLSILFVLIFVELIIYIIFSEVFIVHFVDEYNFSKINKIFICTYFFIDMILRLVFILLFERGLYRLATSRSFKSNLKLFGFGGASIDQIELSCVPLDNASTYTTATSGTSTPGEISSTTGTSNDCDVAMPLKDQVNGNKSQKKRPSIINSTASNTTNTNASNAGANFLHPLSYQKTDRDDGLKFALSEQTIPEALNEGDDLMDMEDTSFHYLDDEYQKMNQENDTLRSITNMNEDDNANIINQPDLYGDSNENVNVVNERDDNDGGTRTPTPPINISTTSIQSTMTHSIDTPSVTVTQTQKTKLWPALSVLS